MMRQWWLDLSPRERLLVSAASGILLLVLIYVLGIEPLQIRLQRLQGELAGQVRTLETLQALGQEAAALRAAGVNTGQLAAGQSLLSLVNESARAAGFAAALERIVPNGNAEASVVLREVSFNTLVGWLARLQASAGVQATRLAIDAGTGPGKVNANLTLTAGTAP